MEKAPSLTAAQRAVFESGVLDLAYNGILQMPTGSGKTWLAGQAIQAVLERGRRAIYLSPLRALAGELHQSWKQQFQPVNGCEKVNNFAHLPKIDGDAAGVTLKVPRAISSRRRLIFGTFPFPILKSYFAAISVSFALASGDTRILKTISSSGDGAGAGRTVSSPSAMRCKRLLRLGFSL
jgi:hypothetical protein